MPLHEKDNFLQEVLSYIHFPFDREDISSELENHILDKTNDYREQGYSWDEAESLAVQDMGDTRDIGRALNKQHNPVLGWIWLATNVVVVMLIFYSVIIFVFPLISSVLSFNKIDKIPAADIVYKVDVNKKVKLDDRVINFSKVILSKGEDLHIYYEYYDTRLWGMGWSHPGIGNIFDNLGNQYGTGGTDEIGAIVSRCRKTVSNFSIEADTLIIDYDQYNRKYRVEIPLAGRCNNE